MGESNGCFYFVMDYVAGTDAHALVRKEGPLAIGRAVRLTCQLLEALEYAHDRGFVHRDIKPANVLIAAANGGETAKLADFGLARVYQSSQWSGLTLSGEVGGTPSFMAPEQVLNFRDSPPSVDQYAAAATLYYLLTGNFVYDVPKEMHLLYAMILNDDPVAIRRRRAEVPAELEKVIHRALAREPGKRYRSVEGLRMSLAALQVPE
jgi:serine/threonine-protein kinase